MASNSQPSTHTFHADSMWMNSPGMSPEPTKWRSSTPAFDTRSGKRESWGERVKSMGSPGRKVTVVAVTDSTMCIEARKRPVSPLRVQTRSGSSSSSIITMRPTGMSLVLATVTVVLPRVAPPVIGMR